MNPNSNEPLMEESKPNLWPFVAAAAFAGLAIAAYVAIRKRRDQMPEINSLLDMCEDAVSELELRLAPSDGALAS